MWLYLEEESLIFIETVTFALAFFGFQLTMAINARRVALKLLPIYIFSFFALVLLATPFIITDNLRGNWGVMLATIFNLGELAFIALFIGLAWIAFAIYRACNKNIK